MAAEDKKNGNGHMAGGVCMGCSSCGCSGRGRSWTFFLLRTLITIIILMVVFWFGVAAGRLGNVGANRYYMMRSGMTVNPGGPIMPVTGTATTTP